MPYHLRFRARLAIDRLKSLVSVPLRCDQQGSPSDLAARPSPRDSLSFEVGGRAALLCYGRPSARGRRIFGELVPYGELWRLGANEPTVLHLPFACRVAGIAVRKGKLALYVIPHPDRWTLVLNRSTRQWGLTRPERGPRGRLHPSAYTAAVASAELGRADVETCHIPYVERLTARAEPDGERRTLLLFEWEETRAAVPLEI